MEFMKNGCEIVRGVLSNLELEPIKEVVEREVERRVNELYSNGKITEKFENLPFNRRWIEVCKTQKQREMGWNREIFSIEVYNLCTNAKILDIIEGIIGPEVTVNGDYWVRPKLPNEGLTTLPWHQDSFYYNDGQNGGSDSADIVSVWIPLVDVDETNGCLQTIPDSNQWGLIPSVRNSQGHLEPVEDVENRGRVETLRMKVGDVFLFDQLTLHRSLPNLSNEIRWSIDLRYSPTDQPFSWHSNPEFEKIYPSLIARSKSDPKRVMGWDEWYNKHLQRI